MNLLFPLKEVEDEASDVERIVLTYLAGIGKYL